MADELRGRRIALLATDGVEQVELEQPRDAVVHAGGEVDLLSVTGGEIQGMNRDVNAADRFAVNHLVSAVSVDQYDGLILPGGTTNPDRLRLNEDAVRFVRDFARSGKPVAAICHGPWMLVEADVVRDRTLTSFPSLRTDIRNAGGNPVDREVVVDGNFVTSRDPGDLKAFCAALVELFARRPVGAS